MVGVTIEAPAQNIQHQDKPYGPLTVAGGTVKIDGVPTYRSFKDENGEPSDLIFEGGSIELFPDKDEISKYNYELFMLMREQGVIPASLGLRVTDLRDRIKNGEAIRQLRKKAEEAVDALVEAAKESESKAEFLGVAIRLGADVNDMDFAEIREFIYDQALATPQRVIDEINNPDAGLFLLVEKAKTILRYDDGAWHWKGHTLGYNTNGIVANLKANPEIVSGIRNDLNKTNQPKVVNRAPAQQAKQGDIDSEDLEEETRALKQTNQVPTTEEALEIGQRVGMITFKQSRPGKGNTWAYNGLEVGKEKQHILDFLEANETVRATIGARK